MRVTAAKDGVLVRRRLRIFAAAVALVLLCAVCVGGVSGADVWTGSVDTTWAGSGTQANPYLITSASSSQVFLVWLIPVKVIPGNISGSLLIFL